MNAPLQRNMTPGDLAAALRSWLGLDPRGALAAELAERTGAAPWMANLSGLVVHDRRDDVRDAEHARGRPGPPRPWSAIYGATVHQTASGHLDSDHPGILSIPAHVLIHGDASLSLLHPLCLRLSHGHALNGPTIGVEVDCRADGIEGDPDTFWRSREEIDGWRRDKLGRKVKFVGIRTRAQLRREATDAQLATLTGVLLYCHGAFMHQAPREHWPHWGVYTHRQGHESRTADPGSRIARHCDAVRRSMGWKDVSGEAYGSGRPWDPRWITGDGRVAA